VIYGGLYYYAYNGEKKNKPVNEENTYLIDDYTKYLLDETEIEYLINKEEKSVLACSEEQPFLIIDKKQDHKGKKLLSSNELAKLEAVNEFFKREKEVLDMFLGDGGVDKLLNGRKMGWTSLQEITEIITEQIAPYFDKTMENITEKVKEAYKNVSEEKDVI